MTIRAKQASWPLVVLMVVAVVLWGRDQWMASRGEPGRTPPVAREAAPGGYQRIDGCRWVEHRQNDGDSFRVKLPDGRVEQLRLYFVDAPESEFRTYGGGRSNHQRISDQARDMGLSPEQAVRVGAEAKERVRDLLSERPFRIFTVWEDPFGDKRYHAFVELPEGSGGWLHEWLVEEGMVRIHTRGAALPDGTSRRDQERRLHELERESRRRQLGAWSESGR